MCEAAKYRLVGGAGSVHDVGCSMRGVRVGKAYRLLGFLWRDRKLRGKGEFVKGVQMWGWSENMMRVLSWEGMCWNYLDGEEWKMVEDVVREFCELGLWDEEDTDGTKRYVWERMFVVHWGRDRMWWIEE